MSGSDIVRIAQEVSPQAAEALMRAFGGRTVYLPREPGPGHVMSRAVGVEIARAIADLLGPGHLDVPRGDLAARQEKAAQGMVLIRAGKSEAEIARTLGVSARTVRRWRRLTREDAQ